MAWKKLAHKVHQSLAILIFIQMLGWLIGGAYFALVPFQSWVKSQDWLAPEPAITTPWPSAFAPGQVDALKLVQSAAGPLIEYRQSKQTHRVRLADATPVDSLSPEQISTYAQQRYAGEGELISVKFLDQVPSRWLGLVDELGQRGLVWQAQFDDHRSTRFYFDQQGVFITARNDYWVWFDALWRIHIMDYGQGEDFNNPLLRILSVLAVILAISGSALALSSLLRRVSRWKKKLAIAQKVT
ncbi:hypothetical protein [Paraferrimonas sedimenticola]|uniref:PepSY domain-containing protein n=1 Tax=Paraferrimonas sedimenticola TaxID=375674 RepID=A0AA37RVE8_9GAMM|nr:hypothetical protein [Paraferrimonas sedimenticola]GLP95933.1 hypothetical protein GCM10007895_12390 [Paraferrimonas sedimenticola]